MQEVMDRTMGYSNTHEERGFRMELNALELALLQLQNEIEALLHNHKKILKTESALANVDRLHQMVERSQDGSQRAQRKLSQEGLGLLEDTCSRMRMALEEQQRIIAESPAVSSNAQGKVVEKYVTACAHISKATDLLKNIIQSCSALA